MAFTPTKFLRANSHILLRDFQHASRTFVSDQFRLAPKFDFQFHVAFNINPAAMKTIDLSQRHRNEINMLVKKIGLPKFTIATDQVNQYNRKKQIQTQHKFEDINITFHDDNMSLINQLWQNYYSYYYADSTSAKSSGAYNRNATKNSNFIKTAYGLDNGSTAPFFNYIKIYQMARHEYVSYKLHNPIIKAFDHKELGYASKELHEFTMGIAYEAVSYDMGTVNSTNVEGFGLEHYDLTPSPLQGLPEVDRASPSFVAQKNVTNNAVESLNNTATSINSYQNIQTKPSLGVTGLLSADTIQTVGGIQDTTFPQSLNVANSNVTVAKKINLGIESSGRDSA
jgi:hypothetical protein